MSKSPRDLLSDGLLDALDQIEVDAELARPRRTYVGGSGIGKKCERALWYTFRWCSPKKISPRVQRRAETGHRWEERAIELLRAAGLVVESPEGQFGWSYLRGLYEGHLDGTILGVPFAEKTLHLFECKAMVSGKYEWEEGPNGEKPYEVPLRQRKDYNDWFPGRFWAVKNKGVKKAEPVYWDQLQAYMGASHTHWKEWGLTGPLKRAFFFAVNTDLDVFYHERIKYVPERARALFEKARRIIQSQTPPKRWSEDPNDWECNFCEHKETCHVGAEYVASCRNCAHMIIDSDYHWVCAKSRIADMTPPFGRCSFKVGGNLSTDWEPNLG